MPTEDFFKRTATFKGLSLNDNIGILTGSDVPWNTYTGVPLGSRYFKHDGVEYKKIGASDLQAGWAIDYTNSLPQVVPTTTQYAYNSATVSNATVTYVNAVSLVATTIVGITYLAKFSGIAKTPTSQGCTIGFFNGATEVTNSGFRINHLDTELLVNLVLPITATSTSTNIILKIKSGSAGKTCTLRNSLISLEALV